MAIIRELAGQRIGRLLVQARDGQDRWGVYYWLCQCDCGKTTRITTGHLTRKKPVRSCGCLSAETSKLTHSTHGKTKTLEWLAWRSMRMRCAVKRGVTFRTYGARGITVCERWHSFENFLADMGLKPSPQHSLDRYPNQNGNYEPGNCRWATRLQQAGNTRANRLLRFQGHVKPLAQWARELGVTPVCIASRLKAGWPLEAALTRAPRADYRRGS